MNNKPELVSVKFGETTKKVFVTLRVNLNFEKQSDWKDQVIEAVKAWG